MANTTKEVDEISQIVKRVVEWSKDHPGLSLDDLEKQVQKAVVELRKKLMEVTVEAQGRGELTQTHCQCGGRLVFQGYRRRKIVTGQGCIEVERAYYTCEKCKAGFFPPG